MERTCKHCGHEELETHCKATIAYRVAEDRPDLPTPPDLDSGFDLDAWMALPPEARADAQWAKAIRVMQAKVMDLEERLDRMKEML